MPKMRAIAAVALLAMGASASSGTYTVKWGDTLARVARKLHVPVKALVAVNHIADADKIRQGQVLVVPDPASAQLAVAKPIAAVSPAAGPPPAVAAVTKPASATHVVQPGETLAAIAKQSGTTVADLVQRNAIKNPNQVRIGMSLQVPAPPAPPALCPVKGATRFDIANNFGAPRPNHHQHMGDDIFAKRGTDVIAPAAGTIRFANGKVAGFAFYLDADDGTTYYGAHLGGFDVRPGPVDRGAVIGPVGTSGNADGTPPHLHFEIHPNRAAAVDPHAPLTAMCG